MLLETNYLILMQLSNSKKYMRYCNNYSNMTRAFFSVNLTGRRLTSHENEESQEDLGLNGIEMDLTLRFVPWVGNWLDI